MRHLLALALLALAALAAPALADNAHVRIPVDHAGTFAVEVELVGDALQMRTAAEPSVPAETVGQLATGMKLVAAKQSMAATLPGEAAQALALPEGRTSCEVQMFGRTIATFDAVRRSGLTRPKVVVQISAFELRQFGQRGALRGRDSLNNDSVVLKGENARVDLHTHFGGAMRARSIIEVADEFAIPFPTALLDEIGVKYPSTAVVDVWGKPHVPLTTANIGEAGQQKLETRLSIRSGQVQTFMNMEDCYRFRTPLVKSVKAFGRYLEELAKDYASTGVGYAELSISDVLKPDWLAEAHRVLPKIEKSTGVKIRFLAAFWRHSDKVYNMDLVEKIKALGASPYIVGADFMGHETNSTRAFADVLKQLAEFKASVNPAFVIRVHAGENPLVAENVREAINAGATRIGHGLYGMDAATLKLAKERGVIVEFNMNSNLALNNIGGPTDVPIKAYVDAGVRVTLGTDGHGLYHTNNKSEEAAARLAGLKDADLAKVRDSDRAHVQLMEQAFKKRMAASGSLKVPAEMPAPKFTAEYSKKLDEERAARLVLLKGGLGTRAIQLVDPAGIAGAFPGMVPVLFSGASAKSWALISAENQAKVEKMIDAVLGSLDPKKALIVTGATDFGVEKVVHARAKAAGFTILGSIVEDTKAEELGPITHAVVMGQTWYDKSARVLAMVRDSKGVVIFVGGGNIIKDEIQSAFNGKITFYLMEGPEGAAHDAIAVFPGRKFSENQHLLSSLKLLLRDAYAGPRAPESAAESAAAETGATSQTAPGAKASAARFFRKLEEETRKPGKGAAASATAVPVFAGPAAPTGLDGSGVNLGVPPEVLEAISSPVVLKELNAQLGEQGRIASVSAEGNEVRFRIESGAGRGFRATLRGTETAVSAE